MAGWRPAGEQGPETGMPEEEGKKPGPGQGGSKRPQQEQPSTRTRGNQSISLTARAADKGASWRPARSYAERPPFQTGPGHLRQSPPSLRSGRRSWGYTLGGFSQTRGIVLNPGHGRGEHPESTGCRGRACGESPQISLTLRNGSSQPSNVNSFQIWNHCENEKHRWGQQETKGRLLLTALLSCLSRVDLRTLGSLGPDLEGPVAPSAPAFLSLCAHPV